MRYIGVFILFFLGTLVAVAQKPVVNNLTTYDYKRLHFGFSLGVNVLDFGFVHYATMNESSYNINSELQDDNDITYDDKVRADLQKLIPGFSVAIVSNLRLNNAFDLRFLPGMSFGERRLVYNYPVYDVNNPDITEYFSTKSTFLDFPLLIKYKSCRINNQRPYLIAGGSYRIDISKTGVEDLVRLKRNSYYIDLGVGLDSYLQFFRLSTEFKVSIGLNNILDTPGDGQLEYYTDAIKRLTSNVFTFSFHFE